MRWKYIWAALASFILLIAVDGQNGRVDASAQPLKSELIRAAEFVLFSQESHPPLRTSTLPEVYAAVQPFLDSLSQHTTSRHSITWAVNATSAVLQSAFRALNIAAAAAGNDAAFKAQPLHYLV